MSIEGRLPYVSPEQTGRMNRSVDFRSDLYSLAVVLFGAILTIGGPAGAPTKVLAHRLVCEQPAAQRRLGEV